MKETFKLNRDTRYLKNKIQATYAFTLAIFAMSITIINITSLSIAGTAINLDILKYTVVLTIIGCILSIPTYTLQNRIEKADIKQLKISNYLFNFCLGLLSVFFIFLIYLLFSYTLLL